MIVCTWYMQLSWSTLCTMRRTRTVTVCWFQAQEFGILFSLPCWTCPVGTWGKGILLYPQSLLSGRWGSCGFFVVENFSQPSIRLYFWLNYTAENDNRWLHGSIWDGHKSFFLEGCPENVCRESLLLHICSSVVTLVKVSTLAWWVHAKFEVSLCP
jgi:hypothetical protein